MTGDELEQLGAQYREAKAAIGTHRIKQAKAEVAYAAAVKSGDEAATALALDAVNKAVADVAWCQAVMVAAGEAYKGESFMDVVARNEAHRSK